MPGGRQTQCISCHRFLTGAPQPEVDHQGAPHGSLCTLPHHPDPCEWHDEQGNPCTHHQPGAAGGEDELTRLRVQMQRLQEERDEERRRAELLQMTNSNLMSVQSRL